MIRDFTIVAANFDKLLSGLANTALLSLAGTILSLMFGALFAMALISKQRTIAMGGQYLLDAMRCIPFLLLVYVVYYGLPSLGINFGNWTAGLSALVIYNTAYMAEIIRGSWRQLPKEQTEAAASFGFHGFQLYRRIVLPPVILSAVPMVGNQVIQIVKDTAFLTIIAVAELTHEASSIQSKYYVPFAALITAVALYWVLCRIIETGVALVETIAEERR
ncbi:MAG: amino acid ABC transporter permease [Rhodomicrobium sp.]